MITGVVTLLIIGGVTPIRPDRKIISGVIRLGV